MKMFRVCECGVGRMSANPIVSALYQTSRGPKGSNQGDEEDARYPENPSHQNPYNFAGLSTKIILRRAMFGTQVASRFNIRPSSIGSAGETSKGWRPLALSTCGQSEPHKTRSGLAATNTFASAVTSA